MICPDVTCTVTHRHWHPFQLLAGEGARRCVEHTTVCDNEPRCYAPRPAAPVRPSRFEVTDDDDVEAALTAADYADWEQRVYTDEDVAETEYEAMARSVLDLIPDSEQLIYRLSEASAAAGTIAGKLHGLTLRVDAALKLHAPVRWYTDDCDDPDCGRGHVEVSAGIFHADVFDLVCECCSGGDLDYVTGDPAPWPCPTARALGVTS